MGRRTFAPDLATLTQALRHALVHIQKAILFGSRARCDYMEHSDWDLVIVSPDFLGMSFSQRASLLLVAVPLHPAEYFCYTPEEFERGQEEIGVLRQALVERGGSAPGRLALYNRPRNACPYLSADHVVPGCP